LSGLARRYVQPLFEVARDAGALDRVADEMKALDEALNASPDLRGFLASPTVERSVKRAALDKLFAGASQHTLNFLRLVVNKNRSEILILAGRIFSDLLNAHRGITPGLVETAVPLDESVYASLESAAARRVGGKLQIKRRVDPALIGGVRIRVGNRVVDASVRGRLEKLRALIKK